MNKLKLSPKALQLLHDIAKNNGAPLRVIHELLPTEEDFKFMSPDFIIEVLSANLVSVIKFNFLPIDPDSQCRRGWQDLALNVDSDKALHIISEIRKEMAGQA